MDVSCEPVELGDHQCGVMEATETESLRDLRTVITLPAPIPKRVSLGLVSSFCKSIAIQTPRGEAKDHSGADAQIVLTFVEVVGQAGGKKLGFDGPH